MMVLHCKTGVELMEQNDSVILDISLGSLGKVGTICVILVFSLLTISMLGCNGEFSCFIIRTKYTRLNLREEE